MLTSSRVFFYYVLYLKSFRSPTAIVVLFLLYNYYLKKPFRWENIWWLSSCKIGVCDIIFFHIISERGISCFFFLTNCALATAHFKNEESGCQLQCLVREIIYDVTELTAAKNTKHVRENTCLHCQVRELRLIRVGSLSECQWRMHCTCILVETIKTKSLNYGIAFQDFCFFVPLFHIPNSQSSCFQIWDEDQSLFASLKLCSRHRSRVNLIHLSLVLKLEV